MKSSLIIYIALFCIFIIIGIPTYLCGCDSMIQPNCIKYDIVNATVIGYDIITKNCSYCKQCTSYINNTSLCINNTCIYKYYDCYTSYTLFEYNLNNINHTCSIVIDINNFNYNNSYNDAINKYINGTTYNLYVDKVSNNCLIGNDIKTLAIVGFIFLILSGIVLSIILIIIIKIYVNKYNIRKKYKEYMQL
jgi:hypothetical protein